MDLKKLQKNRRGKKLTLSADEIVLTYNLYYSSKRIAISDVARKMETSTYIVKAIIQRQGIYDLILTEMGVIHHV